MAPGPETASRATAEITNPGVTGLPTGASEVSFASGGARCAAWHFGPGVSGTCVVMAPGAGVLKELGLPRYGARFAAAGHDVVMFDFRRFGQSGGTPRQVASIRDEREDLRAAVRYARTLAGVERVVLWGMSLAGGLVLDVAADDEAITAAISQCPLASGPALAPRMPLGLSLRTGVHVVRDLVRAALGRSPHYIPLAAGPGEVGSRSGQEALGAFDALNPDRHPWPQEIAARFMLAVALYRPLAKAGRIRCPLLVVAAEDDGLVGTGPVANVARRAPRAELLRIPGDHYEPFRDSFERCIGAQLQFLERTSATG